MSNLVRDRLPWWFKLAAKLALSRAGLPHSAWRRLGIFRRGEMLDPDYAAGVFERHYSAVKEFLPPAFSVLELGPGDSLSTAVVARAFGAGETWLVDSGPFASMDIGAYQGLLRRFAAQDGRRDRYSSVGAMMEAENARYLSEGLASLRTIPDGRIDFIISHAVLEHVPLGEFESTVGELYRVSKPGGVGSHRVDLKDHLQNGLNSLRFSGALWESRWFASSGFYTNRLRSGQLLASFRRAGFRDVSVRVDRWESLPLPRRRLAPEFADQPDEELLIRGLDFVCRK